MSQRDDDVPLELPLPAPPPLSPSLRQAMAGLKPVATRRPLRSLALVIAASLAWMAAIVALRPHRADMASLPQPWWIAVGAAWLGGFVAPLALALLPRRGAVLPDGARAFRAAIAVAVALVVVALALTPSAPQTIVPATMDEAAHRAMHCLVRGIFFAAPPLVLALLALRRLLLVGSARLLAAVGAAGGALGGLILHVLCPFGGALHLGCGHAGAVLLTAAIGAIAGWAIERWS